MKNKIFGSKKPSADAPKASTGSKNHSSQTDHLEYPNVCSVVMLTKEAFRETLRLIYSPKNQDDEFHLYCFATAICDLWSDIGGNVDNWDNYMGWLEQQEIFHPPFSIAELGALADYIEVQLNAAVAMGFNC
jgi:hypothetical protein